VEAGGWRGEVQDAVGVDVVCSEGGTESCLRIGGGANWIGNIIGGTGLVGGLFSIQLPLALLLSSCFRNFMPLVFYIIRNQSICFRTLRSIGICMCAVIHTDPMGAAVLSAHQCKST
jgi:hypothetical protein